MIAALAIFTVTYALLAGARLPGLRVERSTTALLGAGAMLVVGVLSPRTLLDGAINVDTLLLLLGTMLVSAHLEEAGLFQWASWKTLTTFRTRRSLLIAIVFVSGLASAVLVNDTICLMFTPLVVRLIVDARLRALPYLLALAFGANAGSVATPTGNPQNMIIATASGLGYARFTAALLPPALAALFVVAATLLVLFRRDVGDDPLSAVDLDAPSVDPPLARLSLGVLALLVAAFLVGLPMSWSALTAGGVLLALGRRPFRATLGRVDGKLLILFAALFVVVHGVAQSGLSEALFHRISPALGTSATEQAARFGLFTVLMSQLVSNVPFVLLASRWIPSFSDPTSMWLSTALFSTLAGNLTIVGSVANIIVLEGAGEHGRVGFFTFLKYGALVTALTLAAGFGVLWIERSFGLL